WGGSAVPDRMQVTAVLLDIVLALGGEMGNRAPVGFLGVDKAFVGELGYHRIHRAGAGHPGALRAVSDLLDDLVAVLWLVGQQGQHRQPDVTTIPFAAAAAKPRVHGP